MLTGRVGTGFTKVNLVPTRLANVVPKIPNLITTCVGLREA